MSNAAPPLVDFVITKEFRLFSEFCEAVRRYKYIGVCYGPPGVGKTLSARRVAQWSILERLLPFGPAEHFPEELDPRECHTLLYTPQVSHTPRKIYTEMTKLHQHLNYLIAGVLHVRGEEVFPNGLPANHINLLIVDEVDWLKAPALEQLRGIADKEQIGMVFIGMPGLQKRLSRYPQLYSRVGHVHQFNPLQTDEVKSLLAKQWNYWGLSLQAEDFTDTEAVATMIHLTGGNFRLLNRLCTEIERVLRVNKMHLVTKEVVETASQDLVYGEE